MTTLKKETKKKRTKRPIEWATKVFPCESRLPRITDTFPTKPSEVLIEICQYARGAGSRGDALFVENYLKGALALFSKTIRMDTEVDGYGNVIVYVEGEHRDTVLHVAHVDSVHSNNVPPFQEVSVDEANILRVVGTPKNSIVRTKTVEFFENNVATKRKIEVIETPTYQNSLGADDGVGVAIMLCMIRDGISGTYFFSRDEEVGCVGTHYAIDNMTFPYENYSMAIEIDRAGTNEIVAEMGVGKTGSKAFADALADQLNMNHEWSDRGSVTDIAHFSEHIPECVNLAAGYKSQHSSAEWCDLDYVDALYDNLCIVDFGELPIKRIRGDYTSDSIRNEVARYGMGASRRIDNLWSGIASHGYDNIYSRTPFGDYSRDDLLSSTAFFEEDTLIVERFVARNSGFIAAFLMDQGLSPQIILESLQDNYPDEVAQVCNEAGLEGIF